MKVGLNIRKMHNTYMHVHAFSMYIRKLYTGGEAPALCSWDQAAGGYATILGSIWNEDTGWRLAV